MSWHRWTSILAVFAVASVGVVPTGVGCTVDSQTPHACCHTTVTMPEIVSCFSGDSQHVPDQRSTVEVGCHCPHGTGVLAQIATTASWQPDDGVLGAGAGSPTADLNADQTVGAVGFSGLTGPPPPLIFLLDCAFLI